MGIRVIRDAVVALVATVVAAAALLLVKSRDVV
jgi:hypothetical protein